MIPFCVSQSFTINIRYIYIFIYLYGILRANECTSLSKSYYVRFIHIHMVLNSTVYIYLYIAYSLTYINGQYKNDVDNKTFANQQIGVSWFLQLRLLLRLHLQTAIILCMKFQSKSYIHIYKVYI